MSPKLSTESNHKGEGGQKTPNLDYVIHEWSLKKSFGYYSGAHISWHELFLAGNQDNHQNLVPSLLTYKF